MLMKKSYLIGLAGAAFLLGATPIHAASFVGTSDKNATVTINQPVADDLFVASRTVSVDESVAGEAFVAGNSVTIRQSVGRSIFAAGNSVSIEKGSSYNTFAAGNTVTLKGTYAHDVYVMGSSVSLDDSTVIKGSLYAAATDLTLRGTITGDVKASAATINSSAVIGGNFKAWDDSLSFSAGSIGGNLAYTSANTATGLSNIKITGTTEQTEPSKTSPFTEFLDWGISALGVLLLGLLLIYLLPKKLEDVDTDILSTWSSRFGQGFATLFLVPIIAIIGFVIAVGWQVSFVLLALYIASLFIAYVIGVLAVGNWIIKRTRMAHTNWAALVIGILAISVLTSLPGVGKLFSFLFFICLFIPSLGFLVARLRNRA